MRIVLSIVFLLGLAAVPVPARALDVPSAIVGADWLSAHLDDPGLSVIEMSTDVSFEFDGHVPGAVSTTRSDWRFQDTDGAVVRRPLDVLERTVRDLGVDDGDAVVIYAKGNALYEVLGAAYLFWLFHLLGHDNVALLDEGWVGWQKAEGAESTDMPTVRPGTFVARHRPELQVSTDAMFAAYKAGFKGAPAIDGRPAGHFAGRTKFPLNTRFGRIPGAVSQPWPDYIAETEDGLVYMKSDKPKLLEGAPWKPDDKLLLTCFGGTGSSMNFVLFRHHGYRNMTVHDGGMARWNLRDLPLVKD